MAIFRQLDLTAIISWVCWNALSGRNGFRFWYSYRMASLVSWPSGCGGQKLIRVGESLELSRGICWSSTW